MKFLPDETIYLFKSNQLNEDVKRILGYGFLCGNSEKLLREFSRSFGGRLSHSTARIYKKELWQGAA